MIEKIMSKLGMVVLWSCVIIYGVYIFLLLFFTNIIGLAVLAVLAIIVIAFKLYRNRYKYCSRGKSRCLVRFARSRPMILTSCPKNNLPNLLILPTSSSHTSLRQRSSFSVATITSFFLITLRLGARRLRRSRHLSPRKPQKQKLKCIP